MCAKKPEKLCMIEAGGKLEGIRISDALHKWRGISIEICRLMEYYKNVGFFGWFIFGGYDEKI